VDVLTLRYWLGVAGAVNSVIGIIVLLLHGHDGGWRRVLDSITKEKKLLVNQK